MSVSSAFIGRPIGTTLLSLAILLAGIAGAPVVACSAGRLEPIARATTGRIVAIDAIASET